MNGKGFTLLELLITLTILACLSVLTSTSYSYLARKNEQQVIVDELKTALQYAKVQTLIRGHAVVLSPLDDSLDWTKGMVLTAGSKKALILHQWQWTHPRWNLSWVGMRAGDKIIFSPNPAHAISNGRFTLKNLDTQQNTVIILNRLGRIKEHNNLSLTR